jgi:PIN domain nuclease of toxin-antitoxin system
LLPRLLLDTHIVVRWLIDNRKLSREQFRVLQARPVFQILPVTYEVAAEAASLGNLRDPADRAIVATARAHRLTLMTSDERIIESKLVPVVA